MPSFEAGSNPVEAFLRAPSPLLDPVDPWVGIEGDELVLESGERYPVRFTTPGEGVMRVRVGAGAGVTDPSPMLRPDYVESPVDGGTIHHGPFRPGEPYAAGGRLGGDRPGWLVTCFLEPAAAVYGGGESAHGPDLRGRLRHCVNVENTGLHGVDRVYLNVPFFWSDAGWGVFFHTGAPVLADLGAHHSEVAAFAVEGERLDLFVIEGSPAEILRRYLDVTGLPGRFPDWALGVWSSRCSYLSAAELDDIVRSYAEADAPVDVVHVDAWGTGHLLKDLTCDWEIDRDRFPEGWTKPLAAQGVRVSLWHNPYVRRGSAPAEFLLDEPTPDMPHRFVVDFTAPEAVAWWKGNIASLVAREGHAACKPDFAEEVPPSAVCADGRTGWEVRNEYSLRYQQATHEAMVEATGDPQGAVALFCRSGTAGSQRYPCHWVGDTPSTWTGLVGALRTCLSLSLSGFGLVAHDVGGFWTPEGFAPMWQAFNAMDPSKFIADVDPELYARWAQWGALSPVMRFHGIGRREPFAYPEPYRSAALAACRLRRSLRPYLVATAAESADIGTPMMRPMVLATPDDRAARDAELQYLLGPDLLVAPVLAPGGRTDVYVPEGRWEPLVGLDPVEGPGWTTVDVPLDCFPAWVSEGRWGTPRS